MLILGMDTSTRAGSVALLRNDQVLGEILVHSGIAHSESILPAASRIIEQSGIAPRDIDLFAVTVGPGSFTGLRIGVSIVKGLAFASSRPVAGVSTLEALAWNFCFSARPVCTLLDAKKGQVYAALFKPGDGGLPRREGEILAIEPDKLLKVLPDDVILAGEGAVRYEGVFLPAFGPGSFAPPHLHLIRAASVALLGKGLFAAGRTVEAAALAPVYIRPSEAEQSVTANDQDPHFIKDH
jgi:tRNA threonylcarbamoyladenosine biosynthesis protein TsaB